jgi:hypothetical protein
MEREQQGKEGDHQSSHTDDLTTIEPVSVREIQRLVAALPDRDRRSPEEIIGYDERGLSS